MENLAIKTEIERVVVYPDRALIIRRGTVELAAGQSQLTVDALPLALNIDSVRAKGEGVPVRLHSVDVALHNYVETPAERVRELQQQLEGIEDELRAVDDDQRLLQGRLTYLDSLQQQAEQFARGLALGRSSVEDQAALLKFMHEHQATAYAEQRELARRRRQLQQTQQYIKAQLQQLQTAASRQRYRATVVVEAQQAGRFTLELSYVVKSAAWQPLYDVRLTQRLSVEVTFLAQVTQRTDEIWEHITLELSTARPALNQRRPELQPWFIDQFVAPPPLMPSAERRSKLALAAPVAESAVAEVAVAEQKSEGTTISFVAAGHSDIPGDGSTRQVVLAQFELEPRIDYFTAPVDTPAVYRRVTLINSSNFPLLAGSVKLFDENGFIGHNRIKYTPRQAKIELLLGVEDRIVVERELTRRQTDKKLLRDRRSVLYGYSTKVRNLLDRAVVVTLEDRIPVSRHEQIKVKLELVRPSAAEQSDLNLFKWHIPLDPDEERSIDYEFSIAHPTDMHVSGLLE